MAKKITAQAAAKELSRRRAIKVDRLGEWLHDLMWAAMPRIVELEKRMQRLEDAHQAGHTEGIGEPADASNPAERQ